MYIGFQVFIQICFPGYCEDINQLASSIVLTLKTLRKMYSLGAGYGQRSNIALHPVFDGLHTVLAYPLVGPGSNIVLGY